MNLDLPNHLESTRQLLHRSLGLRPSEVPPAIPNSLVRDMQLRFSPTQRLIVEPPKRTENFFQQVLRLLSTPAIGATAIIVGVMFFAVPALLPSDQPETFRGTSNSAATFIPIYVTGGPTEMPEVLASSGDLNTEAIVRIDSRASALELQGPKVLVDFDAAEVLSFNADGQIIARDQLPEDIGLLSLAVAQAVSRL